MKTKQITKANSSAKADMVFNDYCEAFAEPVEETIDYEIIKDKKFKLRPMDVEEAILQMNLLSHEFFMFQNAETGDINVVYKRDNGGYALLEPDNT